MPLNQHIQDCIDKGVCHVCGEPVIEGQLIYTITMAHAHCQFPPDKPVPFIQPKPKPDYIQFNWIRAGIAAGGQLVHWVRVAHGVSLCGHQPKRTATHMKQRGRWLVFLDGHGPRHNQRYCSTCIQRLAQDLRMPILHR